MTALTEKFERRPATMRDAGRPWTRGVAQIERPRVEVTELRKRVAARDRTIVYLKDPRQRAGSWLPSTTPWARLAGHGAAAPMVVAGDAPRGLMGPQTK
ncbi:hypothetical protein ABTY00_06415 [Streptomyces microflavus]|uniref:hypothetical protein n=1 Tax=Streptomyces microflavus TaxID=1919 RepID=UPI003323E547